ncbi:hypothetical protein VKT23_010875 [Stygiomarasmius scandens]|uniref:F-box domain-containing protein n=1 Tax=Marasmiellus scandens TaxID=2682957 RepID=A0ABR1JCY3_9AGAR
MWCEHEDGERHVRERIESMYSPSGFTSKSNKHLSSSSTSSSSSVLSPQIPLPTILQTILPHTPHLSRISIHLRNCLVQDFFRYNDLSRLPKQIRELSLEFQYHEGLLSYSLPSYFTSISRSTSPCPSFVLTPKLGGGVETTSGPGSCSVKHLILNDVQTTGLSSSSLPWIQKLVLKGVVPIGVVRDFVGACRKLAQYDFDLDVTVGGEKLTIEDVPRKVREAEGFHKEMEKLRSDEKKMEKRKSIEKLMEQTDEEDHVAFMAEIQRLIEEGTDEEVLDMIGVFKRPVEKEKQPTRKILARPSSAFFSASKPNHASSPSTSSSSISSSSSCDVPEVDGSYAYDLSDIPPALSDMWLSLRQIAEREAMGERREDDLVSKKFAERAIVGLLRVGGTGMKESRNDGQEKTSVPKQESKPDLPKAQARTPKQMASRSTSASTLRKSKISKPKPIAVLASTRPRSHIRTDSSASLPDSISSSRSTLGSPLAFSSEDESASDSESAFDSQSENELESYYPEVPSDFDSNHKSDADSDSESLVPISSSLANAHPDLTPSPYPTSIFNGFIGKPEPAPAIRFSFSEPIPPSPVSDSGPESSDGSESENESEADSAETETESKSDAEEDRSTTPTPPTSPLSPGPRVNTNASIRTLRALPAPPPSSFGGVSIHPDRQLRAPKAGTGTGKRPSTATGTPQFTQSGSGSNIKALMAATSRNGSTPQLASSSSLVKSTSTTHYTNIPRHGSPLPPRPRIFGPGPGPASSSVSLKRPSIPRPSSSSSRAKISLGARTGYGSGSGPRDVIGRRPATATGAVTTDASAAITAVSRPGSSRSTGANTIRAQFVPSSTSPRALERVITIGFDDTASTFGTEETPSAAKEEGREEESKAVVDALATATQVSAPSNPTPNANSADTNTRTKFHLHIPSLRSSTSPLNKFGFGQRKPSLSGLTLSLKPKFGSMLGLGTIRGSRSAGAAGPGNNSSSNATPANAAAGASSPPVVTVMRPNPVPGRHSTDSYLDSRVSASSQRPRPLPQPPRLGLAIEPSSLPPPPSSTPIPRPHFTPTIREPSLSWNGSAFAARFGSGFSKSLVNLNANPSSQNEEKQQQRPRKNSLGLSLPSVRLGKRPGTTQGLAHTRSKQGRGQQLDKGEVEPEEERIQFPSHPAVHPPPSIRRAGSSSTATSNSNSISRGGGFASFADASEARESTEAGTGAGLIIRVNDEEDQEGTTTRERGREPTSISQTPTPEQTKFKLSHHLRLRVSSPGPGIRKRLESFSSLKAKVNMVPVRLGLGSLKDKDKGPARGHLKETSAGTVSSGSTFSTGHGDRDHYNPYSPDYEYPTPPHPTSLKQSADSADSIAVGVVNIVHGDDHEYDPYADDRRGYEPTLKPRETSQGQKRRSRHKQEIDLASSVAESDPEDEEDLGHPYLVQRQVDRYQTMPRATMSDAHLPGGVTRSASALGGSSGGRMSVSLSRGSLDVNMEKAMYMGTSSRLDGGDDDSRLNGVGIRNQVWRSLRAKAKAERRRGGWPVRGLTG